MCRGPRTRTSASWTEHTSGFFFGFFWFSVPTSSGAEKQDLITAVTTMRGKTHPPLNWESTLPFSATSRLDTSPARESAFGSPEQVRSC